MQFYESRQLDRANELRHKSGNTGGYYHLTPYHYNSYSYPAGDHDDPLFFVLDIIMLSGFSIGTYLTCLTLLANGIGKLTNIILKIPYRGRDPVISQITKVMLCLIGSMYLVALAALLVRIKKLPEAE